MGDWGRQITSISRSVNPILTKAGRECILSWEPRNTHTRFSFASICDLSKACVNLAKSTTIGDIQFPLAPKKETNLGPKSLPPSPDQMEASLGCTTLRGNDSPARAVLVPGPLVEFAMAANRKKCPQAARVAAAAAEEPQLTGGGRDDRVTTAPRLMHSGPRFDRRFGI